MKKGLWGHALLLASKIDTRAQADVMLRFANSLPINDPLQTLYQLMSGRQPASVTVNISFQCLNRNIYFDVLVSC